MDNAISNPLEDAVTASNLVQGNARLSEQVKVLQQQLDGINRQLFGRKSEKHLAQSRRSTGQESVA